MAKVRKPRQQRARDTVASIVEAGFICLSRHGIAGTTTHHIADIAGVSVGSLYEYFANKEAVFDAMHEHVVRDVVDMIRPLIPELVQMDARAAVTRLLYAFRDLLQRNDGRYLKYAGYAVYFAPQRHLDPINRVLSELMLQYLMHNPRIARIKSIPTMSYIIITGGIFTVIRYLSEPNPSITFDQLAEGLADMVSHLASGELRKVEKREERGKTSDG